MCGSKTSSIWSRGFVYARKQVASLAGASTGGNLDPRTPVKLPACLGKLSAPEVCLLSHQTPAVSLWRPSTSMSSACHRLRHRKRHGTPVRYQAAYWRPQAGAGCATRHRDSPVLAFRSPDVARREARKCRQPASSALMKLEANRAVVVIHLFRQLIIITELKQVAQMPVSCSHDH